jgi:dipeptidyl aminopeptidase/acylaminoacyl peptidase
MAHALTTAHKSVERVELSGEDHWLSRRDTRTRMLHEIEKFLGAHL